MRCHKQVLKSVSWDPCMLFAHKEKTPRCPQRSKVKDICEYTANVAHNNCQIVHKSLAKSILTHIDQTVATWDTDRSFKTQQPLAAADTQHPGILHKK